MVKDWKKSEWDKNVNMDAEPEFFEKQNPSFNKCPECFRELKIIYNKIICLNCRLILEPKK